MRIINRDIVGTSCFTTMDEKIVNGESVPDLKFPPTNIDATNSNGILSPPITPSTGTPSENEDTPTASNSGRFKFYKDGKIILELWHQKNGERMFWIPVLKNSTCWPPVGHCTPRQESSTSLSVSDDNLSVQSSPWQRDHCWKQAVPRKNINRELEFLMCIAKPRKMRFLLATIQKRRRRPYDAIIKSEASKCQTTGFGNTVCSDIDVKPQLAVKMEVEPFVERERLGPGTVRTRRRLKDVLQKLLDRRSNECTPAISSCRTDPGIVSPRKRILREMEKVSLEEMGNANKKYKAQTVFSSCSSAVAPCTTVTVVTGGSSSAAAPVVYGPPAAVTAITASTTTTTSGAAIKSTNSHSISSILSRDEEQLSFLRNLLKSPTDTRPSGSSAISNSGAGESLSTSSSPVGGMDGCDPHDVRSSRSIRSSTPISSTLVSPMPLVSSLSASPGLYATTSKSLPQQLPPSLHAPPPLPMYIAPAFLYHNSPQPFLASPPISNHPPYYPAFPAAGFRDTSSMWSVPPVSSLGRQSVYPSTNLLSSYPPMNLSPWVPIVPSPMQNYPVAENATDVPLNLSKH